MTVGTALLVGLGIPALEAAAYTLVSSSLPPIFGAMGIPVVVLSAGAEGSLASLAPDAYLPKPFELDRLLDVVGRYCTPH